MDDHQAAGDVAGGEDVWRGRAKLGVDLHVAALVGVHTGGGEVEPGGVRDPADGNDRDGRVDQVLRVVLGVDQPDAGGAGLEALDDSGIREDVDPRRCAARRRLLRQRPGRR